MRHRYPSVEIPNTRRARWLADLVARGAFTAGGLLRRRTVDPDTGEAIRPEVSRVPNRIACRAWARGKAGA